MPASLICLKHCVIVLLSSCCAYTRVPVQVLGLKSKLEIAEQLMEKLRNQNSGYGRDVYELRTVVKDRDDMVRMCQVVARPK